MAFDGTEGEYFTPEEAGVFTANFRKANENRPGTVTGVFFGREKINSILEQAGCVGIRFYFGKEADGTNNLVLVGVDKNEKDILELVVEMGQRCPPYCSDLNALNS